MPLDVERPAAVHGGEVAGDYLAGNRVRREATTPDCHTRRGEQRAQDAYTVQCRTSHHEMRCLPRPRSSTESTVPLETEISLFVPPIPPALGRRVGVDA